MKPIFSGVIAVGLLTGALTAQAQFQRPDDAVKYRQSALFMMGQHFGRVGAMANGRVPFDAAIAQKEMDVVMALAPLPWAGFTPETRDIRSRAQPNVWTEKAKFDEAGQNALKSLTALDAATKTGSTPCAARLRKPPRPARPATTTSATDRRVQACSESRRSISW